MEKNAIIIGGTSGIGLETARYLESRGCRVVIGGRNKIADDKLIYNKIDVTNEESIKNFMDSLPFGQIDSLVYSAGITTSKKNIYDFDVNEYMKVHDVNLLGAILVLKYAFPLLKKAKGKVVVVSSIAARTYSKFSGIEYTISKAGLMGMVKQLAIEWANDSVLINSVFPSMVYTSMLRDNVGKDILNEINMSIPLGRIASKDELVPSIAFLINEDNTYITGAGIDVNGGQFLTG